MPEFRKSGAIPPWFHGFQTAENSELSADVAQLIDGFERFFEPVQ